METKKIPAIRINIVEAEGWKTWDPGGDIVEWASDNAWDDWNNMDDSTCREHVGDLVAASMNKREQKKIDDDDLDRVCIYLREEGWAGDLESTHHAIVDALTWMWEEAYTPDDGDIGSAMEKAAEDWADEAEFGTYWNLVMGERPLPRTGPKEWIPQVMKWREKEVVGELLKQVTYERKPGWYDRYVVFDFGAAEPVKDLLEATDEQKRLLEGRIRALDGEVPGLPQTQEGYNRRAAIEDEVKEIQEEIDELEETPRKLKNEFDAWADQYLRLFFSALEKVMHDAEPYRKTDFDKHWKAMLRDKQTMRGVREEILEFLKKPAEKAE